MHSTNTHQQISFFIFWQCIFHRYPHHQSIHKGKPHISKSPVSLFPFAVNESASDLYQLRGYIPHLHLLVSSKLPLYPPVFSMPLIPMNFIYPKSSSITLSVYTILHSPLLLPAGTLTPVHPHSPHHHAQIPVLRHNKNVIHALALIVHYHQRQRKRLFNALAIIPEKTNLAANKLIISIMIYSKSLTND